MMDCLALLYPEIPKDDELNDPPSENLFPYKSIFLWLAMQHPPLKSDNIIRAFREDAFFERDEEAAMRYYLSVLSKMKLSAILKVIDSLQKSIAADSLCLYKFKQKIKAKYGMWQITQAVLSHPRNNSLTDAHLVKLRKSTLTDHEVIDWMLKSYTVR